MGSILHKYKQAAKTVHTSLLLNCLLVNLLSYYLLSLDKSGMRDYWGVEVVTALGCKKLKPFYSDEIATMNAERSYLLYVWFGEQKSPNTSYVF